MPLTLHLPGIALDLAVLGSKTLSKILCEKFCGNFQTQKNKRDPFNSTANSFQNEAILSPTFSFLNFVFSGAFLNKSKIALKKEGA